MGEKSIYRKLFFIFEQEDTGFGSGQSPSGYIKLEARDGKGKLTAVVQNLKEDTKSIAYKIYIMKCTESDFKPVLAGIIPINKNKGELNWEFSPDNISGMGITIDNINTAAVIAENKNAENKEIKCPLAAYKEKKTDWRNKLREKIYFKKDNKPVSNNIDNLKINNNSEPAKPENIETEKMNHQHEVIDNYSYEMPSDKNPAAESTDFNNQKLDNQLSGYEEYKDMIEKAGYNYSANNNASGMPCGNIGCNYVSDNNGISPCTNCFVQKTHAENADTATQGDVDRLRIDLDRSFEICDPFRSRRRDYKWWKVNSPVHLNNVLFQCNIKTPVLFNPKILMSHFKYRHLIFGIYTDTVRQKEYVVFGVPGVYNVDDRPFKDICRWAQVEGNKPRYGAFGYWLVYIDPKTGKIV